MVKVMCNLKLNEGCNGYLTEAHSEHQVKVTVSFKKRINRNTFFKQIKKAEVVFWYSGEDGFTRRCSEFYKKTFSEFFNNQNVSLFLYDLWAWKGLQGNVHRLHQKNLELASPAGNGQIVSASGFFRYLCDCSDEIAHFFKTHILSSTSRAFIFEKSKKHIARLQEKEQNAENKVRVKDLFCEGNNPFFRVLSALDGEKDTAWMCSALQYLEGLWLCMRIIEKNLLQGNCDIPIFFILPFGESEYYLPKEEANENAFCNDVKKLFLLSFPGISSVNINIIFMDFFYGEKDQLGNNIGRPYVFAPGDELIAPRIQTVLTKLSLKDPETTLYNPEMANAASSQINLLTPSNELNDSVCQ